VTTEGKLRVLQFGVATLAGACGGLWTSDREERNDNSEVGDGGPTGSEQEAARDGGPSDGSCFGTNQVRTCAEVYDDDYYADLSPVELVAASSLGPEARFVRVGGWAVLAEQPTLGADRWSVVLFSPERLEATAFPVQWDSAEDDFAVLDVLESRGSIDESRGLPVVALGCDGAGCTILGKGASENSLRPVAGYELPPGASVDRLVVGYRGLREDEQICVYGDGLWCHDGLEWSSEIAAGSAPRLRAVILDDPGVAVGEAGTVLVQREYGEWQALDAGTTETLTGVIRGQLSSTAVFGEGGFWQAVFWEGGAEAQAGAVFACQQDPPFIEAVQGPAGWLFVDAAGLVHQVQCHSDRQSCEWCQYLALGGREVLDHSRPGCGSQSYPLVLTSDALFLLAHWIDCFSTLPD
jgi:hypothetical protein